MDSVEYDAVCNGILAGQSQSISHGSSYSWCRRNDSLSDAEYLTKTKDCKKFITAMRYNDYTVTEEEQNFPLAFSIITHENLEQMER